MNLPVAPPSSPEGAPSPAPPLSQDVDVPVVPSKPATGGPVGNNRAGSEPLFTQQTRQWASSHNRPYSEPLHTTDHTVSLSPHNSPGSEPLSTQQTRQWASPHSRPGSEPLSTQQTRQCEPLSTLKTTQWESLHTTDQVVSLSSHSRTKTTLTWMKQLTKNMLQRFNQTRKRLKGHPKPNSADFYLQWS